ncbi:hypothetical protein C2S51_018200 [Perilla frutescens var. frutescens]|nr:hypothetical protein C2S51_018200 [Perilla frutescens var. frutescens]
MPSNLINGTLAGDGFSAAVATWYGSPTGSGSACGFANDVVNDPYYGMISAGNQNIFRSGAGCGTCYMVKCTQSPYCSGSPITVTITDECPGKCNNEAFHFDLSGKAFGYLAKKGQGDALRKLGRINIQYSRVRCFYKSNIAVKIDSGSNPNYLAFAVENMNGDGEIGYIEITPSGRGSLVMRRDWGETWKVNVPSGVRGPFSVKLTDVHSRSVYADRVIPIDWVAGRTYYSKVNFS